MTIRLERQRTEGGFAPMAQSVHIRDHVLIADGSVAEGGTDAGPDPHDLYDAALAACKALTLMWYARRRGIPVGELRTTIERDNSAERTGVYRLVARLAVGGELSDAQLQDLQRVADKCPVHKLMTQVTTEISTQLERLP